MLLFRDYGYKVDQKFCNDNEITKMLSFSTRKKLPLMKPRLLLTPVLISLSFIFFWLPFAIVEVLKTFGIFAKTVSLKIYILSNKYSKISFNLVAYNHTLTLVYQKLYALQLILASFMVFAFEQQTNRKICTIYFLLIHNY